MNTKLIAIAGTIISTGSIALASNTLVADSTADCFRQYITDIESCNQNFDDEYGVPGTYNDPLAYTTCIQGANINSDNCNNNLGADLFAEAFATFQEHLKICLAVFSGEGDIEAKEACIAGALRQYQFDVQAIIDAQNNNTGCTPDLSGIAFVNPITPLYDAAVAAGNPDGKYSTKVDTTLNFSTGFNPDPAQPYDASQIPCIKNAVAFAIYPTKTGVEVLPFDADSDTTDGTNFNLYLFAKDLIHAKNVEIVTVFYDQNAVPAIAEYSTITLDDSTIAGDWNRDQVLNTQDVIDFLDTYNAQAKRADLNNDSQVTPQDAIDFTNGYTQ